MFDFPPAVALTFSREIENELRGCLGEHADDAMPHLRYLAERYRTRARLHPRRRAMSRRSEARLTRRVNQLRKAVDLLIEELGDPSKTTGIFQFSGVQSINWPMSLYEMKKVLTFSVNRRRGPTPDPDRLGLDATIAAVLRHFGVRVARSRDGVFARILALVHEAVGIRPGVENFKALKQAADAVENNAYYSWCEYEFRVLDQQLVNSLTDEQMFARMNAATVGDSTPRGPRPPDAKGRPHGLSVLIRAALQPF